MKAIFSIFSRIFSLRRRKYYRRCQEIIDDIHSRVANNEYVSEERCHKLYGTSEYQALQHELHLMGANIDRHTMTPAMEWLYYSRYFDNKDGEEIRQLYAFVISVISLILSTISLIITYNSKAKDNAQVLPAIEATKEYCTKTQENTDYIFPGGVSDEIHDVFNSKEENKPGNDYEKEKDTTRNGGIWGYRTIRIGSW